MPGTRSWPRSGRLASQAANVEGHSEGQCAWGWWEGAACPLQGGRPLRPRSGTCEDRLSHEIFLVSLPGERLAQ